MELRLRYPPTPEAAPRHAALCVSAALVIYDIDLDYTSESLRVVDDILGHMHQGGAAMERMAELLFAFGCYVGEVFVHQERGRWCRAEGTPLEEGAGFPLILQLGPERYCNPIGKVFKRLAVGAEHGLWRFYAGLTPRELH